MSAVQIIAVLDPDDSPETHRRVAAMADPKRRTVVVELRPHARRIQSIAEDVLHAYDKDLTRAGADRNGQESWAQATAWVIGEKTQHLIVTRCHTMPTLYIETFAELAALASARLTLLYGAATHNRGTRETLRRLGIQVVPLSKSPIKPVNPRKQKNDRPSGGRGSAASDEQLPDDDFPTFYAAARRDLRGATWQPFDTTYQEALCAAGDAWTAHPPRSVEEIASSMLGIVLPSASPNELLIKVRAVQVSALHAGYLIGWHVVGAALTVRPRPDNPSALQTLRRYAAARHATMGLLALLSPTASLSALSEVRIGDVSPDGYTITIAGDTIAVPPTAAGILRAQRLHRIMMGAPANHGLIQADTRAMTNTGGDLLSSTATIHRLLRTIEAETGIPVLARRNRRKDESALAWAKRAGFTIKPLPKPPWKRS